MGATVDEATIYVAEVFPRPLNTTSYKAVCLVVFKTDYNQVIEKYPPVRIAENTSLDFCCGVGASNHSFFVCAQENGWSNNPVSF